MAYLGASDRRKDNLGKEDLGIKVFGVIFRWGFSLPILLIPYHFWRNFHRIVGRTSNLFLNGARKIIRDLHFGVHM